MHRILDADCQDTPTLFQSPNSRNVFTVTQANKKHNSPEPEGKAAWTMST
jgi:hypothetical protein